MANEEEFRKVARRREEMTSVLILLEEILTNYQINMLLISFIITLIGPNTRKRKRWCRDDPTNMLDSIPGHVKQLNKLVRVTDRACVDNLRMDRNTFGRLCRLLRDRVGLIDQKFVTVEEQVAMFLCVLSHHKKTRVVGYDFMRSSQTVSRYMHIVLRGVLTLHNLFLVKPNPIDDACTDRRWNWFKGCLGALDGTYINVRVPIADAPRYRNRKGHITTNTLAVCDPHLRFVYVLPGWEGSAGDSRILRDAISRPLGLKVPKGCYYLCDSAYANAEGFVTPYKGVRYHLKEWGPGTQAPQTPINDDGGSNYAPLLYIRRDVQQHCIKLISKMHSKIPPQKAFFYQGKWSRELDTLLLSTLISMRSGRDWEDANVPHEVLRNVRGVINPPFGADLTCEDIALRVRQMKGRYLLFKKVVNTKGAYWNIEDKVVIADEATWKLIFQRDASARAYYHRDEPEYSLLANLFGLFDVKVESPPEVITLSDNTEVIVLTETMVPDAPARGNRHESPADSDEVNSPMSGPSTRVCRKLFDVGGPCFDEMSSTMSPTRFSPPKKEIFNSPKGSSCASWSPCPTSRKTAP